jgi:hypothetical protein
VEVLMPQEKDLKRLVRERMLQTGERYTTARTALTNPDPPQLVAARALIAALGDKARADDAYRSLEGLASDLRRGVCVEGLRDPDPKVRRRCARLLDDLAITPESERALREALRDPQPSVRGAAFHALICEACKPEACDIDARALIDQMFADPSAELRRAAVGSLWRMEDDDELLNRLRALAAEDVSARVRADVRDSIEFFERQRAASDARRASPAALQEKMAKHAGKWVAVANGSIVSADRFEGQLRRDIRGKAASNAIICWVPAKKTN